MGQINPALEQTLPRLQMNTQVWLIPRGCYYQGMVDALGEVNAQVFKADTVLQIVHSWLLYVRPVRPSNAAPTGGAFQGFTRVGLEEVVGEAFGWSAYSLPTRTNVSKAFTICPKMWRLSCW